MLAVPGPWRGSELADAPESAALLRDAAARGHEIALHGWTHTAQPGGGRTRRLSGAFAARGAGEFWALDEAARRCLRTLRGKLAPRGVTVNSDLLNKFLRAFASTRKFREDYAAFIE